MNIPLSTSIHLFFDSKTSPTLNAQIERHIDAGFRFLDFNFLDWASADDLPFMRDGWRAWLESGRKTAEARGARFNQAHAPMPVCCLGQEYEKYVRACVRAFDGAQLLGIPWMVFHHLPPKAYGFADKWDADRRFFERMQAEAHRTGVGIAVENLFCGGEIDGKTVLPVEYPLRLAEYFDDPLIGICCDVGHAHIEKFNRVSPDDSVNPADAIRRYGDRLKALHIHDNSGAGDEHIPPFYGSINWADVIAALRDIRYAHSFTFEAHNTARRFPESEKDRAAAHLYQTGVYLVGQLNAE